MAKINLKQLQKRMEERLTKQRRNKGNWTKHEGYSIKKTPEFIVAHGKYIRGE